MTDEMIRALDWILIWNKIIELYSALITTGWQFTLVSVALSEHIIARVKLDKVVHYFVLVEYKYIQTAYSRQLSSTHSSRVHRVYDVVIRELFVVIELLVLGI